MPRKAAIVVTKNAQRNCVDCGSAPNTIVRSATETAAERYCDVVSNAPADPWRSAGMSRVPMTNIEVYMIPWPKPLSSRPGSRFVA